MLMQLHRIMGKMVVYGHDKRIKDDVTVYHI